MFIKIYFFIIFVILNFKNNYASPILLDSVLSSTSSGSFFIETEFCPPPLLYRYSSDLEGDKGRGYKYVEFPNGTISHCVHPCPSLYFSDGDWTTMMDMSLIVATISFFASIFLILTYSPLMNPSYNNRHTIGILSMSFGIFLIMFTDMYNLKKRFTLGCPSETRYAVQNDADCLITGLIFQFGCVSAVFFWTALSLDLYFQITNRNISRKYDLYYFIGVNLISLIFTFVPVISKSYGYGDFALGCWILDFNYALGCFWIPLSVCLIFSTVVVLMILYEVYKIYKASNQKTSLKGHIKPLLCLISNCFEFFYVFGYSLYLATKLTELHDNMDAYIKCLFLNSQNDPDSYTCPDHRLKLGPQFLFFLSLRLLGVSGIVFYGTNSKVRKIWKNSILINNRFIGKYFSFNSGTSTPAGSKNRSKTSSQLYDNSFGDSGILEEIREYDEKVKNGIIVTPGGDDDNNINNNNNNNNINNENNENDTQEIELTNINTIDNV
ncbi:hypothetical protein ACTFIR_003324 [Dictyostelium discoideum]